MFRFSFGEIGGQKVEFRKEDIQVLRTKSRATSQVTLDMDYNVPDVKPDIGRMIQNKGDVTVEEVRLNDGHAFVKGKLQADVLYVGEEDGRVYSLSACLPVEETLNLDGIANGDKLCLKWEIEDLSIHIIHSRKLNIRAVITLYASVDELTGIRLPVVADDENISVKKKQMRLLSLAVHKKDTLRLKEEIELVSNKPDIAELLWYTIEVRGLDLKLYREEEHDVIMDAYTPFRQYQPKGRTEMLESLLIRNFSRCRLSDRVTIRETQGKILQICHSQGEVKVDKTQIVSDGIQVDGILRLKVLYIVGNDDMPFYSAETVIPFSHTVEAKGISKDSVYYLHTELEQLSTTMADSNELEIRAMLGVNVLVIQCSEEFILDKMEEHPLDQEKIRSMPGITVYIVQPEDTLWDIAKRFYTTTEEISSMNALENEEISSGTPLLLVKKVEE